MEGRGRHSILKGLVYAEAYKQECTSNIWGISSKYILYTLGNTEKSECWDQSFITRWLCQKVQRLIRAAQQLRQQTRGISGRALGWVHLLQGLKEIDVCESRQNAMH